MMYSLALYFDWMKKALLLPITISGTFLNWKYNTTAEMEKDSCASHPSPPVDTGVII